jgi:PAS domain S-box-containing protein
MERKAMAADTTDHIATCLALTNAISKSRTVDEIYEAALDALSSGLGVSRAAILLFDPDGTMRFKAYRGLSDTYRRAVEGHSPWRPDSPDPQPIWVQDVGADASLASFLPAFAAEGIAALAFIPLVSLERVIGKFMLYYAAPTPSSVEVLQLASVIAAQVAFAIERTRAAQQARWNEERLRFALEAASMGTWDWDLATNELQWSDNLPRIHGLPDGWFDGTFASYEREIHPDDRARVSASIQRALTEGVPHDVEYRLLAPDGTIRWCEGKGRVEYEGGQAVRMSGICMMVTRRKEAELARLAAAEESNRLKDEFLATLSHELRTPLNAILGWVSMLQGGDLPAARARHAVEVIGRNARLQAQLIEDILDVSRIITGQLEIERAPVSVPQLLETAVAGIGPAADAKGVILQPHIPADLPTLHGDLKRLHQVLNNLLSNAVKFTPADGEVTLRCEVDGDWLTILVQDTGVGIAPDFLPYVFDRFRQADSRSNRSHMGLGLGLAIARHLIELHGGDIRAESGGAGTGTTVIVRLPVTATAERVTAGDPSALMTGTRFDDLTFLVVDDEQDSREMLAAVLEHRGARVVQGESAESALSILHQQAVDLVIADIAMPRMDGYELIRRIRAAGHTVPAIAVTAFAAPNDRDHALESGYTAYVPKPIDGGELGRAVREIIPAAAGS